MPNLTIRTNDVVATALADGTVVNVGALASADNLVIDTGLGTYDTINLGGGENSQVVGAVVHTGAGHDTVLVTADDGLDIDGASTATVDFGAGTGTGDGLGLGNTLNVGGGGTATLAQVSGSSHVVVVDSVNVSGDGEVVVADPSTLGDVEVDAGGTAEVDAASTIGTLDVGGTANIEASCTITTLDVENGGFGTITTTGGSTIGTMLVDGTATVEHSCTITLLEGDGTTTFTSTAGTSNVGSADVTNTLEVDSGAQVNLLASSSISTLDITGKVYLNEGTTIWQSNTIGTLNLYNGSSVITGTLDVGLHKVLLTSTEFSDVMAYLSHGWHGGRVDQAGITDTPHHDDDLYLFAVGYATSDDNSTLGLSLSSNEILLKATVQGDANLDGNVDSSDLSLLNNGYTNDGTRWVEGDFNYDGSVDNINFTGDPPGTPPNDMTDLQLWVWDFYGVFPT